MAGLTAAQARNVSRTSGRCFEDIYLMQTGRELRHAPTAVKRDNGVLARLARVGKQIAQQLRDQEFRGAKFVRVTRNERGEEMGFEVDYEAQARHDAEKARLIANMHAETFPKGL